MKKKWRPTTPIPCACGCGQLRPPMDTHGRLARFIRGHNVARGPTDADVEAAWQRATPIREHLLRGGRIVSTPPTERQAMKPGHMSVTINGEEWRTLEPVDDDAEIYRWKADQIAEGVISNVFLFVHRRDKPVYTYVCLRVGRTL